MNAVQARFCYPADSIHRINYAVFDGTDIRLYTSHDDGNTVTHMAALLTNCRHPLPFVGGDGNQAGVEGVAGFRFDSGTSGPGKIILKVQWLGETAWSSEIVVKNTAGTAYSFEYDSFGISVPPGSIHSFILFARKAGDTGATRFESNDAGETWTEL